MSEFSESSSDCNVESVNEFNKINIIDVDNLNDSTVQNNETKPEFKTQNSNNDNNDNNDDNDDNDDYYDNYKNDLEKPEIHFVYIENIIKSHPEINTNIIFCEHPEKLINFSILEYNYKDKYYYFSNEDYKLYSETKYDEDFYFISEKIYSDEKVIIVEGTVGYSYDPKEIKLIYNLVENKIYVSSYYRFLENESDGKLFFDKYKMTNGLAVLNKTNSDGKTESLVQITNDECELLESSSDSIPYFRFPRSKDGVSVPRAVYNIFKVFQDPNRTHPEIIIPSEFYTYSDAKFTKISE
jgi:hypothetical protein